jgi:hypothetical protein
MERRQISPKGEKKNIIKNKPRLSLLLFQLWRWNFYPTGRPFLFDVIQKYRQTTKRLPGIFFSSFYQRWE